MAFHQKPTLLKHLKIDEARGLSNPHWRGWIYSAKDGPKAHPTKKEMDGFVLSLDSFSSFFLLPTRLLECKPCTIRNLKYVEKWTCITLSPLYEGFANIFNMFASAPLICSLTKRRLYCQHSPVEPENGPLEEIPSWKPMDFTVPCQLFKGCYLLVLFSSAFFFKANPEFHPDRSWVVEMWCCLDLRCICRHFLF